MLRIDDEKEQAQFENADITKKLGAGTYNDAFLLGTKPPVAYKLARERYDDNNNSYIPATDNPERSTRVHRTLTGEEAYIINHKTHGKGWISLYHGKPVEMKDELLISQALVKIYLKERRVIIDGCCLDNWKINTNGEVVCIDPGLALKRGSIVSDEAWKTEIKYYKDYWKNMSMKSYPNISKVAVNIILNLKYIEDNLTEAQIKDDYIVYPVIEALKTIRGKKIPITEDFLKTITLINQFSPNFIAKNIEWVHANSYLQNIFCHFNLDNDKIRIITQNLFSPSFLKSLKKLEKYATALDSKKMITLLETQKQNLQQIFPHLLQALEALTFLKLASRGNLQKVIQDHDFQTELAKVWDQINRDAYQEINVEFTRNPKLAFLLPETTKKALAFVPIQNSTLDDKDRFKAIIEDDKGELSTTLAKLHDHLSNNEFKDFLDLIHVKKALLTTFFPEQMITFVGKVIRAGLGSQRVINQLIHNHDFPAAIDWFIKKFPMNNNSHSLKTILDFKSYAHAQSEFIEAYQYFKKGDFYKFYHLIKDPQFKNIIPETFMYALRYLNEYRDQISPEEYKKVINNTTLQKAIAAAYEFLEANEFGILKKHTLKDKTAALTFVEKLLKSSDTTDKFIVATMQEWLKTKKSSVTPTSPTAFATQSGLLGSKNTPTFFASSPISVRKRILADMLEFKLNSPS